MTTFPTSFLIQVFTTVPSKHWRLRALKARDLGYLALNLWLFLEYLEYEHQPPFSDHGYQRDSDSVSMGSDGDFKATPIVRVTQKNGIALIPSQLGQQRNGSAMLEDASSLSSKLPVYSDDNFASNFTAVATILPLNVQTPNEEEQQDRGRGRDDSTLSITEGTMNCALAKSPSVLSNKSVHSNYAVGAFPLGTLRVHSTSPVRGNAEKYEYECLKHGDVLVVRDIPVGVAFGYDAVGFTIQKPGVFEGIRSLPPGAHLIWGGANLTSRRQGYWFLCPVRKSDEFGEIIVKRWDKYSETLEEEVSVAEVRNQREELPEIINRLIVYNLDEPGISLSKSGILGKRPHIWAELTSSIQPPLLTKITGHTYNRWLVSSTHDIEPCDKSLNKDGGLDFHKDEVLKFVFPKVSRTFSLDSIGRDRTEQAMDTTSHVRSIVSSCCSHEEPEEIIGELQFCFLTGGMLANIACMEQWAHISKTLFCAYRLAVEWPIFFRKFISLFHAQLFFDDQAMGSSILDHEAGFRNELKMTLITFKSRLTELLISKGSDITEEQALVGKAFEELEAWLLKWGWDLRGNYVRSGRFQLEDGEYIDAELKDFEAEDERGFFHQGNEKEKRSRAISKFIGWV